MNGQKRPSETSKEIGSDELEKLTLSDIRARKDIKSPARIYFLIPAHPPWNELDHKAMNPVSESSKGHCGMALFEAASSL